MGGLLSQLSAAGAFDAQDDLDDPAGDIVYLWPECVEVWGFWQQLQTQWRTGMAGATGLDYAAVRAYLDEQGIEPGSQRREIFACLQACESATLKAWEDLRAKDPPPPSNR